MGVCVRKVEGSPVVKQSRLLAARIPSEEGQEYMR